MFVWTAVIRVRLKAGLFLYIIQYVNYNAFTIKKYKYNFLIEF